MGARLGTTLMDVLGMTRYEVLDLIQAYINQGLIRQQFHITESLAILNYTERATFTKMWDTMTLMCRGLIYNTDTLEILARPFPKFFNHNEEPAAKFQTWETVVVSDKQDGSLGILYREPSTGLAAIATRGSFYSDQALHATRMIQGKYADWARVYEQVEQNDVQVTLLFEIVYPQNRIVLDYGDQDDLVLLGGVAIPDGDILNPYTARIVYGWWGPVTKTLGTMTFGQALVLPPRENAEGIVIRALEDNRMVKSKQKDYVELHRLVTNLTERTVYDALSEGKTIPEIQEPLPEEFHDWVRDVVLRLHEEVNARLDEIEERYLSYCPWQTQDRRSFAQSVAEDPDQWAMFMLYDDDRDRVWQTLWKRARPEPVTPNG